MHRKKIHGTEVIPLSKHRTARDRNIVALIEVVVGWISVLACAALLILLSFRSVPAKEPSAVIFSKIFTDQLDQTSDKKPNI